MVLPAMGMVSDIIAVFARKPIFGYRPMVYSMASIAGLGFIVWAHHMFQSGMNPALGMTFMVSTMFIALPSAIKVFNWLGTLWRGNIIFSATMLYALAFVSMFIIGGLSGIFMAATPVDMYIHDTYFIVAHIHYVVFCGTVMAIFGGITFWFPKMFGRMMNETLGKLHWFLTFVFMNGVFFTMHIIGIGGHQRRIASPELYRNLWHLQHLNVMITVCAIMLGLPRSSCSSSTSSTPCSPARRPSRIRGRPTRWNGPTRRRRPDMATGRALCRSSIVRRTNTARRKSKKTGCRSRCSSAARRGKSAAVRRSLPSH